MRDVIKTMAPVGGLRQAKPTPVYGSSICGVSSLPSEVDRKARRCSTPLRLWNLPDMPVQ